MFVSGTKVERKGTTEMFAHIAITPTLRFVAVHRLGLRYNWWHAPTSSASPTGRVGINVVLHGELTSANQAPSLERSAWVYAEDDCEGSGGARRHGFCAHGEPYRSVAVYLDPAGSLVKLPSDGTPRRFAVPPAVFHACNDYLDTVRRSAAAAQWSPVARRVADALKTAGWLAADLEVSTTARDERFSDVLMQIVGRFDPGAQRAELAERLATTPRRVDRILRSWMTRHGLPDESWREMTLRWRLKMAVLLCSSHDYSVAEVAKVVGYTSPNAMTNAFASAGLHAPSWYRSTDLVSAGRDTTPIQDRAERDPSKV